MDILTSSGLAPKRAWVIAGVVIGFISPAFAGNDVDRWARITPVTDPVPELLLKDTVGCPSESTAVEIIREMNTAGDVGPVMEKADRENCEFFDVGIPIKLMLIHRGPTFSTIKAPPDDTIHYVPSETIMPIQ